MLHTLACLVEPLLRALWPPSGRHRLPTARQARHAWRAECTMPEPTRPHAPLCRQEAHRTEARLQRARRRALWLAEHGIDVGPSLIHGVEVSA